MDERTCTKCHTTKPRADFYGGKTWCKSCYRDWHRQRYTPKHGADDSPRQCVWCGESYSPKTRRVSMYCSAACKAAQRKGSGDERNQHLVRKYGITQADYDAMLAAQGGTCALCDVTPETQRARYTQYFHVDHCHDTGRVRGLLCGEHNLMLGRFGDDPAQLRAAADYLERPPM